MKRLLVILKRGLMIWGAVSLIGIIIFYVTLAYQMSTRKTKIVESDDQDVRFVLECFGRSHDQPMKLAHSYKAPATWSGDYMKAFAMKIAHIEESEIIQRHDVIRGDTLTPIIRSSVEFVTDFTDRDELRWFPTREQILSNACYVYPVRIVLYGTRPDAVHIIVIRPSDQMVFYACVKI
jgi:hypothetical protein